LTNRQPSRSLYGLYIVAACFFVLFMCWGMVLNVFPVLVKPITEDMNWGRGALAVALVMGSLGTALAAPIAGALTDRVGARPVMSVGVLIMGIGLLGGSRAAELWHLYIAFGLVGCGLMFATVIPCSLVISNWFVSRRGTAMSAAFVGASAGGMVMAPVANWIILRWDWRIAFAASGVEILVLVLPVVWFVIRTHPSEKGLEPYYRAELDSPNPDDAWGVTVRGALSRSAFWQLCLIMLVIGLVTSGVGTHCVAYLTDVEHSPTSAALVWSTVMGVSIVGTMLFGPIADLWGVRNAVVALFVCFAVSILILTFAQNYGVALTFAILYGFVLGAPLVLNPLLVGRYLGMQHFGALYGVLNVLGTTGAAMGAVGAGAFFDVYKTYLPVFYFFAALMLATGVMSMFLRSTRPEATAMEEAQPAGVTG
jgi:MFS family permease